MTILYALLALLAAVLVTTITYLYDLTIVIQLAINTDIFKKYCIKCLMTALSLLQKMQRVISF